MLEPRIQYCFLSYLNIGLHIPHKHSPHIYQIINIGSEIYDHKYHEQLVSHIARYEGPRLWHDLLFYQSNPTA